MFYKPEIRKKLRSRRAALDKTVMDIAARRVVTQIISLSDFIESQRLAFYIAQDNELDTTPIIEPAFRLKKQLYLPVVPQSNDKTLLFYSYQPGDTLTSNRYHLLEPCINTQTAIEPTALDLIFVPLVGFDQRGNRLGRGAGYYDHTLDFVNEKLPKRPVIIGLGYEFQKIDHIEPSRWDIPMDYVVTEQNVYIFSTR